MSKPKTKAFRISAVCFLIFLLTLAFAFFWGEVVIQYISNDSHVLFRKILGIIGFLSGALGIIFGMYGLFVRLKLI
jgi:hypothetical protein